MAKANLKSTSRRALLKGATSTAAVAALAVPAQGAQLRQPDPIFAAIEAHRRAHQAWGDALEAAEEFDPDWETVGPWAMQRIMPLRTC